MNQVPTKVAKKTKFVKNYTFWGFASETTKKTDQMGNKFCCNMGRCFPITDKKISSFGEHTAELHRPTYREQHLRHPVNEKQLI